MTEQFPNPMTEPDDTSGLDRSLRRSHRTVLFVIAACAAVSALHAGGGDEGAPDPTFTTVAVGLALAVIVARRTATSRMISPQASVVLTLCSYACASGLAMLGTFVAMTQQAMQTGLVYALAAAIFCLRPPRPMRSLPRAAGRPPGQP